MIWNLDFWENIAYGKPRRLARKLLATEWGRLAVLSSLVANVATAYFFARSTASLKSRNARWHRGNIP